MMEKERHFLLVGNSSFSLARYLDIYTLFCSMYTNPAKSAELTHMAPNLSPCVPNVPRRTLGFNKTNPFRSSGNTACEPLKKKRIGGIPFVSS